MTAREALAQEWRERLEDFAESEMTVQEWCDFNRLSPYQFYYWKRKLARATNPQINTPAFLPVEIVEGPEICVPTPTLTLHIAGAHIDVCPGFDPHLLRAVVQALGANPC